MFWNELADTLIALVEGIEAPAGSGLMVTEALLDIPLEIKGEVQAGKLVFCGIVPHTRWKSGILPQAHMSHLHVTLEDVTASDLEDSSG